MKSILAILFAGLLVSMCGAAPVPTFDSANRLYEEGKFTQAAAGYQALLHSGEVSAAVYFNLGNAFFKTGQLGQAIAAYRRAEELAPRDPDLRANLRFARNQVQGPTLAPAWWQPWLPKLTLNEWTWAAVASVWSFFLLLALGQWQPVKKAALRRYALAVAALALLLCAGLAVALNESRFSASAVIIAREAVVRAGPLDEAQTAFVVHDGSELKVLDQKDNWLQVALDSSHIGWVRRDHALLCQQAIE